MTIKRTIAMMLVAAASAGIACRAQIADAATKGEQALRDRVNAESARVAELKVQVDPAQGIIHSLGKGSRGNDVKLLQQFLKIYGVYPEGMVTGYFGPLTEAAVKKFQEKEGIDSIGIAGPKTRAKIKEISQKSQPVSAAVPAITDAVLSSGIAENGSANGPTNVFTISAQNIYATLSLKNVPQNAQIGYIRYYKEAYLDSSVSHPSRSGLKYFHFQWSLKSGAGRAAGDYSLVLYLNGKKAKTIQYSIH